MGPFVTAAHTCLPDCVTLCHEIVVLASSLDSTCFFNEMQMHENSEAERWKVMARRVFQLGKTSRLERPRPDLGNMVLLLEVMVNDEAKGVKLTFQFL